MPDRFRAPRADGLPSFITFGHLDRVQVNNPLPAIGAHPSVADFGRGWGVRCIAQCRSDAFPPSHNVDWLFDPSGGRGHAPNGWPPHPGDDRLVGYAGDIGPDNGRRRQSKGERVLQVRAFRIAIL